MYKRLTYTQPFPGSEVLGSTFKVERFRVRMFGVYRKSEPRTHNGKHMRIERFEDIEAWQLAKELTRLSNNPTVKGISERIVE